MSSSRSVHDGGMLTAIRSLPQQFEKGRAFVGGVGRELTGIRRVVICGMGGSAFPGDLLRLYASPRGASVHVSRDYVVRAKNLGPEVLVIVSSFSGNTEETLAALDDAQSRNAQIVVVSAGGRLKTAAIERGLPFVEIVRPSSDFQPRAATGFFFGAFATILENAGIIDGVGSDLKALRERLESIDGVEAQAQALASRLAGRIPVVYASDPFVDTAARVIKIKLNENAKIPAFFNGLPELNHNEMVGFSTLTGPFSAVILRDPDLSERMKLRIGVTERVLAENGVPVVPVDLVAGPPVEKLFAVLYLFDFVSCLHAMAAGIDPNPVAMVEDFKDLLGPM